MSKEWTPSEQTDIRRTILENVPESQRMHPVFVRMSRQIDRGDTLPVPPVMVVHKSPEKMQ